MILIYGRLDDPPLARCLEVLQEAGAPYVLLAQSALDYETFRFDLGSDGVQGVLGVAGQQIDLCEFKSVYARPLEIPQCRVRLGNDNHARQMHERLFEWFEISRALVINRPSAMQANASKPFQTQWIGRAGFQVPETLVTSDPEQVRHFWQQHGRIVFKSISGVRSIVQEYNENLAPRLRHLAALPTQFQAYVPGVDVRVHVVGRSVFAAEIRSGAVDYRYASRTNEETSFQPIDLSPEIANRCVEMANTMRLPLAGIDLRRRPDGEYVCFEVNPMPAYTFFESQTGQRISQSLADLLIDRE